MNTTSLTIDIDATHGVIRPELHGHFLEHLGTATYGGMWVGDTSPIPNIRGWRKEAVEFLKDLDIPVLRWPGGCYADDYHWREGIGPPSERPHRVNLWWGMTTEDNSVGTHEFMDLCRLLGAEPYLAGNLGSGTPQELRDWMEYCNYPAGSALSDRRIANGSPEPFRVRYWGVGNESWACGGHMKPEEYCSRYVQFATYLRPFGGVEPVLIAVGPNSNDKEWTQRFFEYFWTGRSWPVRIHGFAMHFYSWGKSTPTEYTVETMREQLSSFAAMETAIGDQMSIMDRFRRDERVGRVLLAIDEWGTWDKSAEETERTHGQFWQLGTMRDGLAAAMALNVFHRQAEHLLMCNLAQLVNVLQSPLLTRGERCLRTPTFHALRMCKGHRGKTALAFDQGPTSADELSVSASRSETELTLTLVNPLHDTRREVQCRLARGRFGSASAELLHHTDFNHANTFEEPDAIIPRPIPVTPSQQSITVDLPPLSVMVITADLHT